MVDIIGRAKVIIEGDVDSRSLDTAGSKIGAGLRKGAVIGVAALGTLAVAGFKAFQSFEEAEAASRKLGQVLDNMGKSAAAPAVEELADKLRKLTGVDDEVIKGGQTILATFSQVAESAGEVGGTFERATRLSLDLAAVMGGDMSGASRQLGKALQDPVKGITALGRAGVTFTAEQKELIKGFVEANDAASAQALILKEVEKQVGGTAEATATESDKIKTALGELQETFGFFIDDLLSGEGATKTFSERLEDLNDELLRLQESEGWEGIRGAIRGIGHAIGFVVGFLGEWSAFWEEAGGDFRDFQTQLDEGYAAMVSGIKDAIEDIGQTISDFPGKLAGFVTKWRTAGKALGQGLIDGIKEGASSIGSNIGNAIRSAINDALGLPRSIKIPEVTIGGKSFGGGSISIDAFAGGVRNYSGGLALVGERGPELVNLPAGSDVYTNQESQRMVGGGDTVVINNQYFGPVTGNEQKREQEWFMRYGLRFGSLTGVSPSVVNS